MKKKFEKQVEVEKPVLKNYTITLTNGYGFGQQTILKGEFSENEIETLLSNVGRDFIFSNPSIHSYNLRFFSLIQVEETK